MSKESQSAGLSTVLGVPKGLQECMRSMRCSCEQLGSARAITLEEFFGPVLRCTEASSEGCVVDYDMGHPGITVAG